MKTLEPMPLSRRELLDSLISGQYQTDAARTLWERPQKELSNCQTMAVWCALGLAGEAGEVVELIKKWAFHNHPYPEEKIIKELGDTLWYVAGLCTTLGLSMTDVMQINIDKLKERYPNGFSYNDSINRKDK